MSIITIDFETFYGTGYSLSGITTEEYIRSPFFEVIGVSVKVNDNPAVWFSGTKEETQAFLDSFEIDKHICIAHNAVFDMAILNWHFGIRPKRIVDTLSMARAIVGSLVGVSLAKLAEHFGLGIKGTEVVQAFNMKRGDFSPDQLAAYGNYCCNDTELTYKLFKVLGEGFPLNEFKLIDLTIRMFTEPVLELDKPKLLSHLIDVQLRKQRLMDKLNYDKADLMSNPKLASLLEFHGVVPPIKISPSTGKNTYAFSKTDEPFTELLEHENLQVQAIVAARLGVKSTLEETRTERFIGIAERGILPVPLRYYAAHTGRWGGCLVGDTKVMVHNLAYGVQAKRIVDILLDDLVWDGESFVRHEGVVFSGYSEVIEWDGVTGTEDHVVFTDAGEISLRDAMQGAHSIQTPRNPTQDDVDAARLEAREHKDSTDSTYETLPMKVYPEGRNMLVPVYDIQNCGPRRRFVANGKLVHNSDKINLQNLQRDSPLKSAMVAPKGFMVVDSDSSQIEARTLAWLAGQNDLVAAFDRKEDVYRIMAAAIYGKAPEDIATKERFVGKFVILGCGYGMGAKKLQISLRNATPSVTMSLEECERIIYTYRDKYPCIPKLWAQGNDVLKAIESGRSTTFGRDGVVVVNMMGIRLPNSLYLRYPNLRGEVDRQGMRGFIYDTLKGRTVVPTKIYGGKVVENVCQALARIVIGEQMLLIAKHYRPVMTVHDAIAIVPPADEVEAAQGYVEQCMRTRPVWAPDLPLACEAGSGPSYGDC